MRIKGIFLVIFAVALAGVSTACARKKQYPEPPAYHRLPSGEFPIIASYAFYTPYITPQQFEWVKEAGFNVIRQSLNPAQIDSCLDLAAKNDLYLLVSPWNMQEVDKIKSITERFSGHPNTWGYRIADEPNISQFPHLKEVVDTLMKYDAGHNGFINLFADAGEKHLGVKSYKKYVEDYVTTVNPAFLSFDFYPVRNNKKGQPYVEYGYYASIETIARVARESNRPFWSYILSNRHWFYPKPTEGFIRFQVFMALGYGAQGVIYYTYLMPDFDKEKREYSDAPIGWDGKRTDTWNMVRNVNREVQNLSHVFLGAEALDVRHAGKIPEGTKPLSRLPAPFRIIDCSGDGVLVSRLKNGENEYLLIVNHDAIHPQNIYLSRTRPVVRIYGDGSEKEEVGPHVALSAGGYALYKLK